MAKRKQKQSLKEFRAWLQGVEELQPVDWAPNSEQWKLIRDKINGIVEEKIVVERTAPPSQAPARPNPGYAQQPLPSNIPLPPVVGGLPPVEVEMTDAARKLLNPGPGGSTKTPDMDTSDGNINSPFV